MEDWWSGGVNLPTPSLTHSQLSHYPFRSPDYDPASRHAPREMGILYQIFTRANGCSANLIWRVQRAIYARIRQTAPHLRIAHILAYMCLRLRRGATLPPVARRDAQRLPWRRGFQPRCPLNVLAYNLTIIQAIAFATWSFGVLEVVKFRRVLPNSETPNSESNRQSDHHLHSTVFRQD